LATGKFELARDILFEFARHVSEGMLPNRFPDTGEEPEYNTVDATLWFFEAVRALCAFTQDSAFVHNELYEQMKDILNWHIKGTRYGIRMGADSLLSAGSPHTQLTWMDAKVGDWVVTPRSGKPVEIQALWYNALCVMKQLADEVGDLKTAQMALSIARTAKRTFLMAFWNKESACLHDVIENGSVDSSIRPNQLFAVSLHYSMLPMTKARRVVDVAREHLLTPFGLRTLSPTDPSYIGRYRGDQVSRDAAYHQGTVWPWLMGPYLESYLKAYGVSKRTIAQAEAWIRPLLSYLQTDGVGQIPEIFDGDPEHAPRGCIAQAWSVAELLRVIHQYGLNPQGT
jgi:predicted glycogen debranching enzyme